MDRAERTIDGRYRTFILRDHRSIVASPGKYENGWTAAAMLHSTGEPDERIGAADIYRGPFTRAEFAAAAEDFQMTETDWIVLEAMAGVIVYEDANGFLEYTTHRTIASLDNAIRDIETGEIDIEC